MPRGMPLQRYANISINRDSIDEAQSSRGSQYKPWGCLWCRRVSLRRNSTKWKTCPSSVLKREINTWPQHRCASASLTLHVSPICGHAESGTVHSGCNALLYRKLFPHCHHTCIPADRFYVSEASRNGRCRESSRSQGTFNRSGTPLNETVSFTKRQPN